MFDLRVFAHDSRLSGRGADDLPSTLQAAGRRSQTSNPRMRLPWQHQSLQHRESGLSRKEASS